MTRFDVVTLFPEMFEALTASGVSRRAYQQQLFELNTWNPRVFTEDRHKTVDDRPYGGGPGMVMMYPPLKKRWMPLTKQCRNPVASCICLLRVRP